MFIIFYLFILLKACIYLTKNKNHYIIININIYFFIHFLRKNILKSTKLIKENLYAEL
jgi:hypothetical protein